MNNILPVDALREFSATWLKSDPRAAAALDSLIACQSRPDAASSDLRASIDSGASIEGTPCAIVLQKDLIERVISHLSSDERPSLGSELYEAAFNAPVLRGPSSTASSFGETPRLTIGQCILVFEMHARSSQGRAEKMLTFCAEFLRDHGPVVE